MRIGLLGGSFDPPHNGHLLAAGDALEALGLARLVFIPAAVQPLKAGTAEASPAQRAAMVRLLVQGDERFDVNPIEIDRGGLSYTVDTLTALAAQWHDARLFWLVGADVAETFHKWRDPERITELATVVILQRAEPGERGGEGDIPGTDALRRRAPLLGRACVLPTRRIDISSTEIRQRVRAGKSIRGFVPDAVAAYIAAEQLYR